MVLQDLLEVVHWLSRVKVTPEIVDGPMVPEADCERGKDLTERLSMGALTRSWQMLLKGLREAQTAPSPIQAAEMILIRLAYLADLPTPADAVKAMADGSGESAPAPQAPPPSGGGNGGGQPVNNGGGQAAQAQVVPEAAPQDVPQAYVEPIVEGLASPETFEDVIALADKMNERILRANLVNNVHLVRFEPGTIVFQPGDNTPREFSQELTRFLNGTTDRRWVVSVSMDEKGGDTVQQRQDAIYAERLKEISETPFMQTVLETFPGAEISEVREIGEAPDIDVDMLDAPSDENIGEDDA